MNKLTFVSYNYWDKETMNLHTEITDEQWEEVHNITRKLNNKYDKEDGCIWHPNLKYRILVSIFNHKVEFNPEIPKECGCNLLVLKLTGICKTESEFFNSKNTQ